jgi:hypothetical protein
LGKDGLTGLLYVKKGADSLKSILIDPTQDKMTILSFFWANMTIFGQIVGLIRILGKDDLISLLM